MLQRPRLHPRRALATWLALAALVLGALAPALSQARAAALGDIAPWALLCSAAGTVPDTGHLSGSAAVLEHCPYCAFQAGDVAPPPRAAAAPAAALAPADLRQASRPALHRSPAWPAAAARGPPRG